MKIRIGPEICGKNYEAPGWILCVGALVRLKGRPGVGFGLESHCQHNKHDTTTVVF